MSQQLPEVITKRLKALLRRVRRLQLYRGLLGVGTVALAGLLVVMAADFFFAPLPTVARWGLFIALLVAVLAMTWGWLCKPLFQKISLVQLARWLETRHPEIQERVSTALELSGTQRGVSESLLEELVDAAKGDVEELDPGVELKGRRMRRSLWPAVCLASVFLFLFLIWPSEVGRLLARAVAPFSETGNAWAARFEIAPGDLELLEGDALEIAIRYTDPQAERLVLSVEREGGEWVEETLAAVGVKDGASEFVYRLPAVSESFRYRARIDKAESDAYRVRVWPLPRMEQVVAGYEFPAYTNRAPEKRPLGRGIKALTGTGVRLEGVPNTPVEKGKFLLDGEEAGTVSVTPGAAGGRIAIDWTLEPEASGLGQVMLTHRLGREVEGLRFPVTVVKDEPPVVTLLTPLKRELRVKPTETIILEYEVQEDVGLAEANIDLRVNGRLVDPWPVPMPERDKTSRVPLWKGQALVSLGEVVDKWSDASELKMRVAVTDTLPEKLEGPGVGYSEWVTVSINRSAESLVKQEIDEQQSDLRETLAEVEKDLWKAKEKLDQSRGPVAREDLPKHEQERVQKTLDTAREELAQAEEKMEELAERMEHGVQASKQDAVEEIAREAEQAREKVENTPLQDTGEERREMIDEARETTQEAIDDLQKLREAIQQDQQRFEELGRLSELAQQEQEIARNAEQQVEEQGTEAPASESLRQDQQQIENALRQQLQQNPEALAEALEQQAEQAQALSEQARELSEQQAALAEMSRDQAQSEQAQGNQEQSEGNQDPADAGNEMSPEEAALAEQIREQLAREQEKIVQETQEQAAEARMNREQRADFLPEAVSDARQALEAIQQQEMQSASESAREAAETLENLAEGGTAAEMAEAESASESGEPSGSESGEPSGSESGEPSGSESGEPSGSESGEPSGSESGEPSGSESGEPSGSESGEPSGSESGEPSGSESGEPSGSESGEPSGSESGEPSGSESGEPSGGESGESSGGGEPDSADPELAALAERQDQVAEALEALAAGDAAEALQALQEMQAAEAAGLAEEIGDLPQASGQSGAMAEAAGHAQQGEQQAAQAAQSGQQGQSEAAAQQHGQASSAMGEAAEALEQAASEFGAQAAEAAGQQPGQRSIPAPPGAMAEAFQQAAQAADAQTAGEAAQASQAAAQALGEAVGQAMQSLKQGGQPAQMAGQPGPPSPPSGMPSGQPGDDPQEGYRQPLPDTGVPPELAKLGVSASDWEKLKEMLRSDVAGGGGAEIPEDYRGLVRKYFEQVAKGER